MKITLKNYVFLSCTLIPSCLSGMISIIKEKQLPYLSTYIKQQMSIRYDIDALINRAKTPELMLETICTIDIDKISEQNKKKLFCSEIMLNTVSLLMHATIKQIKIPSFAAYSLSELQDLLLSITPHLNDSVKNTILEKIYSKNYESPEWHTLYNEIFGPRIEIQKLDHIATMHADIEYEGKRQPLSRQLLIKIITDILERKNNRKLDILSSFRAWRNSFECRLTAAAMPSNALSCKEFHSIKQKYPLIPCDTSEDKNYTSSYTWHAYCTTCKAEYTLPGNQNLYKNDTDKKTIIACNACVQKELNNKIVSLHDCYNLDLNSLYRIIGRTLWSRRSYIESTSSDQLYHEMLHHTPYIHLPLLRILIEHHNIEYDEGDGGFHPSTSHIKIGLNPIVVHEIDIKTLPSFALCEYLMATIECIIQPLNDLPTLLTMLRRIKTNHIIVTLESEKISDAIKSNCGYHILPRDINYNKPLTLQNARMNSLFSCSGARAVSNWKCYEFLLRDLQLKPLDEPCNIAKAADPDAGNTACWVRLRKPTAQRAQE